MLRSAVPMFAVRRWRPDLTDDHQPRLTGSRPLEQEARTRAASSSMGRRGSCIGMTASGVKQQRRQ
jgi:hypothetical protein